jgi:hypothetical protein
MIYYFVIHTEDKTLPQSIVDMVQKTDGWMAGCAEDNSDKRIVVLDVAEHFSLKDVEIRNGVIK